jgi:Phosphatidylinositol 3- and 4-kinase
VPRDERPLETGLTPGIPPALVSGQLEILGLLPNSSNYTFLAKATAGQDEVLAVYKPRRGEIPLWDFPEGTLCRREVAAYVIARELGWPNVPPTVLRDGPEGIGSAQLFVEFDTSQHYFTLEGTHLDEFRRVALFDLIVNNADRKGGHCLLAPDGTIWVIDHGVCFSEEPKLRTVIWAHAGEAIPAELVDDLRALRTSLETEVVRDELSDLLSAGELSTLGSRIDDVTGAGVFPEPGPGRPYPWPPV